MPIFRPECAGQRYEPSNGTEGSFFHSNWCENCARDKAMNGTIPPNVEPQLEDLCQILGDSFMDGGVKEWIFGKDGKPMCTAFVPMGEEPQAMRERCPKTGDLFGG